MTRWSSWALTWCGWRGLIVLSVLFVALYSPVTEFGFVFDDIAEVKNSKALQGPVLNGLTWTQHDHQGTAESLYRVPTHDSYRPLRYLSYQLDAKLFRLAPGAMHIHNLVIALGVVWLVWWFLFLLGVDRRAAFGVTTVFALHPVQVESIAYISARSDLHAGFFALLTACCTLQGLKGRRLLWFLASTVAFLCSMASKEAYLFLGLILAWICWERGTIRRALPALIGQVVVVFLWLTIRSQFVSTSGGGHLGKALSQSGAILRDYLVAFLLPFDSTVVRPIDWGLPWVETILFVLAGSAMGLWWWRTRSEASGRFVLGFLWFVLLLGPSLLAATIFKTLYDHYLYLPVLGLIGLFAQLIALAKTWRRSLGVVASALSGLWFVAMVAFSAFLLPSWSSPASLAERAVTGSPYVGRAWVWWGDILAQEGGCTLANLAYRKAIEVEPQYPVGWNNAGVCALRALELKKSLKYTKKAIALDPSYTKARMNAGAAEELLRHPEAACKYYRSALQLDPKYEKAQAGARRTCRQR